MPFENIAWNVKEFSLSDMTKTNHRLFIDKNRDISQEQADKLALVCTKLLLPIQEKWGKLIIDSGYRCSTLNTLIGGSSNSQHVKCEAVDFVVDNLPEDKYLLDVFDWIYKESDIVFGQLLFEYSSWVHISLGEPYRSKDRCGEVFRYETSPKGVRSHKLITKKSWN